MNKRNQKTIKKKHRKKYIHGGENGTTHTSETSFIKQNLKDIVNPYSEVINPPPQPKDQKTKQKAHEEQESLIAKAKVKDKSDKVKSSILEKIDKKKK